ncbi:MAG: ROK family protein [Planctomycetota bacterium]|jgi:glucokinase
MSKYVIGLDLGGTNMRAGIVSDKGEVILKKSAPTNADSNDGETILKRIGELIDSVIAEKNISKEEVAGAGLGIPGPLDPAIGGAHPPNLKQLSGLPIVKRLKEHTGLNINLENDANAAAWGEYWLGAGKGCRSMLMATLGTGIGGGLVINGELIRGIDWTAGELGHVIVDSSPDARLCGCGGKGCIETYASAISTEKRFVEALENGRESELSGTDKDKITCVEIFQAYKNCDPLAVEVITETGRLLGILCASMSSLLNPEKFIFSGGITREWDILSEIIIKEFKSRAFKIPGERMQILRAGLGDDAGLIGAAGCALKISEISQ